MRTPQNIKVTAASRQKRLCPMTSFMASSMEPPRGTYTQ